ncbi:CDP-diacylglycerol--glycerol-3-phosphate 3-phosphatidyltransferase [Halobacillus karajensis]|uniref:CDP-diacylglycerol--glycerol-3-phosphate 3-phosphatidyltransferase n=1 Tax=Halobacillus karajensis TaxID=195088 RepID=A0A024P1V3_9BACI|nr:CDP-diacylglycerol--glycerol-3-phosphate 3-phosphatidyltransferase [Halobacillus karajensis]CDQ19675.1 CDP-diacylglycerol--glycerol-3-phosphate 3-phosphatidyltransferase [Halobacillus karajensis]CDQ22135.1 CDP-diacylglycerol--glycerol-3-phosphate 3-phosphatidyltransferase [Halobacillus karajensis]CDQ27976.1 CDP-diacylglycerol--glycerol-3-phosphate 3-phosphatidyltransferase [Halobacillus karajensis]SEH74039.1 CDP-diacylglycerol--glycerol-3-phosphate 3-phosphatidyltransferase [Halobacillus kar
MNLPNKITLSRIFLIPIFIILMSVPFEWGTFDMGERELPVAHLAGALLFIIASTTDWIDGYIARKYNLVTNLGKFLDPLADKLLVSAALILLVEIGLAPAWIVILIISREFAVTGLRLVAAGEGSVLAASQMGKLKTWIQIIAISLLLLHNWPFAFIGFPLGMIALYLALFITVYSGYDYFKKNWHVMRDSK